METIFWEILSNECMHIPVRCWPFCRLLKHMQWTLCKSTSCGWIRHSFRKMYANASTLYENQDTKNQPVKLSA